MRWTIHDEARYGCAVFVVVRGRRYKDGRVKLNVVFYPFMEIDTLVEKCVDDPDDGLVVGFGDLNHAQKRRFLRWGSESGKITCPHGD